MRRKWWIIAFSVTLIAACVGVWKWSEPPSYEFMRGSTLSAVYMGSTIPPNSTAEYASEEPLELFVRRARAEFGKDKAGKEVVQDHPTIKGSYLWAVPRAPGTPPPMINLMITGLPEENPHSVACLPPAGTRTMIFVERQPARTIDRVRAWFFALRYRLRR